MFFFFRTVAERSTSAVEKLEIETDVEIVVGFPGDIRIAFFVQYKSDFTIVVHDGISINIVEVADVVIALLSERGFQLKHVQPAE